LTYKALTLTRGAGATALLLGSVTLLILISGCTPSPDADSEIDPPVQNRSEWTLPLDEFVYNYGPLRDYAEALLQKPCYENLGFKWNVPWRPTDLGMGPSINSGMHQLFNEDLASKYGYHRAPNEYENDDAWRAFIEGTESLSTQPGFDAALYKCRGEARSVLPTPSDEAMMYAPNAASTIADEAGLDSKVVDAGSEWGSCMSSRGYAGLTSPTEVLSDELIKKWEIGVPGTRAGQEEIAMATADAECAEQSGWSEAMYEAQWELQTSFVEENASRLVAIRSELRADRERLLSAVAENAPSR
jgi:hypothetical protein